MYAKKFTMYVKFLEAVQSFVRQYDILLLSFIYCDHACFLHWLKIILFFSLSQSFDLHTYTVFNRSTVFTILIKFTSSTDIKIHFPQLPSDHQSNRKFV